MGSFANSSAASKKQKQGGERLGVSFRPENFIPGLIIGFIVGIFVDLSKAKKNSGTKMLTPKDTLQPISFSSSSDEDLKMVLVVRQDLKMGAGKIASQCAHAATGIYSELIQSHRAFLLRQWERCGQAKIVVMQESTRNVSRNKLKDAAENIGLPTFIVADAGRTQVSSGSKTVLAIGPGSKSAVDSVTGKQRLL